MIQYKTFIYWELNWCHWNCRMQGKSNGEMRLSWYGVINPHDDFPPHCVKSLLTTQRHIFSILCIQKNVVEFWLTYIFLMFLLLPFCILFWNFYTQAVLPGCLNGLPEPFFLLHRLTQVRGGLKIPEGLLSVWEFEYFIFLHFIFSFYCAKHCLIVWSANKYLGVGK